MSAEKRSKDEGFEKWFNEQFLVKFKWYDAAAKRNKFLFQSFNIIIIFSSVSTSVIINLEIPNVKMITTFLAVAVSILASLVSFFRYQESWLSFRSTAEFLRREHAFFTTNTGDYAFTDDPNALFIGKVEEIFAWEHSTWRSRRDTQQTQNSN